MLPESVCSITWISHKWWLFFIVNFQGVNLDNGVVQTALLDESIAASNTEENSPIFKFFLDLYVFLCGQNDQAQVESRDPNNRFIHQQSWPEEVQRKQKSKGNPVPGFYTWFIHKHSPNKYVLTCCIIYFISYRSYYHQWVKVWWTISLAFLPNLSGIWTLVEMSVDYFGKPLLPCYHNPPS